MDQAIGNEYDFSHFRLGSNCNIDETEFEILCSSLDKFQQNPITADTLNQDTNTSKLQFLSLWDLCSRLFQVHTIVSGGFVRFLPNYIDRFSFHYLKSHREYYDIYILAKFILQNEFTKFQLCEICRVDLSNPNVLFHFYQDTFLKDFFQESNSIDYENAKEIIKTLGDQIYDIETLCQNLIYRYYFIQYWVRICYFLTQNIEFSKHFETDFTERYFYSRVIFAKFFESENGNEFANLEKFKSRFYTNTLHTLTDNVLQKYNLDFKKWNFYYTITCQKQVNVNLKSTCDKSIISEYLNKKALFINYQIVRDKIFKEEIRFCKMYISFYEKYYAIKYFDFLLDNKQVDLVLTDTDPNKKIQKWIEFSEFIDLKAKIIPFDRLTLKGFLLYDS
jgi:hypothetical protein